MSPQSPLWSEAGMVCLALAAALLGGERERRLAAAGLLVLGLALAAWRAGSPPDTGLIPPGRLGRGFLVGNGGLVLLGSVLVCAAALRAPPGPRRLEARLLAGGGLVLLAPVLTAFLVAGGPLESLALALGLGLAGVAVAAIGRAIAASGPGRLAALRLMSGPLVPMPHSWTRARGWLVLLAVALAVTWLGPHLAVVFAGVTAAVWAGHFGFRAPDRRPLPVSPVLTLVLVPAYWLLAAIAGPPGLSLAALRQIPLSPAAELLVSPALLLAGWAAAGLWPLQGQLPGALLTPAGALLVARVARPLAPGGLEYWQPLTVPLVMLGLWNAAIGGRWPLLLAGAGFLGLVGGTSAGVAASAGLVAVGFGLELGSMPVVSRRVAALVRAASWLLATWAGLRVLENLLRGEVVYTAFGVLGLALIVASGRASASGTGYPAR